jgi:hypothetical protein
MSSHELLGTNVVERIDQDIRELRADSKTLRDKIDSFDEWRANQMRARIWDLSPTEKGVVFVLGHLGGSLLVGLIFSALSLAIAVAIRYLEINSL